jgi:two-component system, LuxR family, response regulator FixJ
MRVVDYNMPGMSGIELVARLEERHLHCPVILITSGAAHDVTERGVHPDIRQVLEKPLEDDALLERIHAVLAAARTRT